MKLKRIKYLLILFVGFFFFGGIPVEFGTEGAFFHGYMIPKPVIRVGLGTNLEDIKIRASSGMKIYEVNASYRIIHEDADAAEIRGAGEKLTEKYVIILAHAKEREEAEQLAADFRARIGGNIFMADDESDAAGVFEIKIGDFLTRGHALAKVAELNAAGFEDVWIEREQILEDPARPIWMLVANQLKSLDRGSELYFIPANPQSLLSLNGRSYRGFFVLKGSSRGLVVVNYLNLEDYLKSVVPGELSPGQFNAIEALKAQAVAARTYAIKNMGQFDRFGYDLVNTPRSQLYMGVSAEHPLSTQAVEETEGEIILYRGRPINALYTSTCGGRTEDAEKVFSGRPVPYLKSVECAYEKQKEWQITARTPVPPITIDGRNASLDIAFLVGLGIIPLGAKPPDFRANATFNEAVDWIRDARRLAGLKDGGFDPDASALDFISLARLLVDAFGWQDRIDELLLPGEVDFLLKDLPQVQGRDRGPLAYCFQSGLIPESVRTGNPQRSVGRAELAMALGRILREEKDFFETGTFRSTGKGTIEVGQDFDRKTLTLSNHLRLLRTIDGESAFATKLTLLGGESVRWLEREGQVAYLEIFYPPNSNVLDRSSRFNRWRVRRTRAELGKQLGQAYAIGGLIDIEVKTRGDSGRVTELVLKGSEGSATVHGFQIRAALGLRDTLFVIDRAYDEQGHVDRFTFSGRGWGHGVGLCQIGAYGMAVAGAKYQDILKKYYTGVKIEKLD